MSNDMECVIKIHNRVGCTCLVYCFDFFSVSLENAVLLYCEE